MQMAIWGIADLHLSFQNNKPMSIFGDNWKGHEEKIKQDWCQKVKEEDTVLLLGDFSWAMYLEETDEDFRYLSSLPGKKILLKGNHDYWWTTVTKMRKFLTDHQFEGIDFLYNNSYEVEGTIIAGTRGWALTDDPEDKRLLERETIRLELSIQEGIKKYGENKPIIVCMHYPPVVKHGQNRISSACIQVMKKYQVKECYYGHLHGAAIHEAVEREVEGIKLKLISCDSLDFQLWKVQD